MLPSAGPTDDVLSSACQLRADEAGALAYAEASLRGANLQGLTDSYGYNAGYLDQILTGAKPTNAMTAPYTGSYGVGLFDGSGQLPTFKTL